MRVDNAIDDVVLSCANRCGRGFMALQCLPLERPVTEGARSR